MVPPLRPLELNLLLFLNSIDGLLTAPSLALKHRTCRDCFRHPSRDCLLAGGSTHPGSFGWCTVDGQHSFVQQTYFSNSCHCRVTFEVARLHFSVFAARSTWTEEPSTRSQVSIHSTSSNTSLARDHFLRPYQNHRSVFCCALLEPRPAVDDIVEQQHTSFRVQSRSVVCARVKLHPRPTFALSAIHAGATPARANCNYGTATKSVTVPSRWRVKSPSKCKQ